MFLYAFHKDKGAAMKSWARITLYVSGTLLIVIAAAYYWLIMESQAPAQNAYALDIAEIRKVAGSIEGDKPTMVEVERVAVFGFPATAVVAGDGWKTTELPVYSYRLVFPTQSIIVDTALDKKSGAGSNIVSFDENAFARMEMAMPQASIIVITHEHMDHLGGLTAHPQLPVLLPAVRLNRDQISHPDLMLPARFPDHALDGYKPIEYERYLAIVPGVVLVKSPGHTPGSQMVYVTTADGKEFLLIGDVAWHFRNIDSQRERARLVTWLLLKEDRSAVFGELAALGQLHRAEPRIQIVPGHDGTVVDPLIASGAMKAKFSVVAEPSN
jgi:glyoxylase-like metal-dependent hydrolase (beta-lactamase superfamily II)